MMGGRWAAGAEPAARRHGRHRQPALLPAALHELDEHVPRRDLRDPTAGRPGQAPRSAPAPTQGPDLLHRRDERPHRTRSIRRSRARAEWDGTSGCGRRRSTTASRHLRPLHQQGRARARPRLGEAKRDELARITSGYSPAMIEQVCSMALTFAHSEGRERFDYDGHLRGDDDDRVRNRDQHRVRDPDETRAVAIHEAGHAAASHVYMKDAESTRLSIRMRGASLGHHQVAEREERFSQMALGADGDADLGPRRDGRRARLLQADLDRRRRRHRRRDRARRIHGRRVGHGPGAGRPSTKASMPRRRLAS